MVRRSLEIAADEIMEAFFRVGSLDPVHEDAIRAVIEERLDEVRADTLHEAYLVARGTHKLHALPKYQQYWKGRAQASNDVRLLRNTKLSAIESMLGELASQWEMAAEGPLTYKESAAIEHCAQDLRSMFGLRKGESVLGGKS